MKKIILISVIALLIGCAGVTVKQESNLFKIGKMAGAFVAVTEPEFITTAMPYAEGVMKIAKSGEISQDVITDALSLLIERYGEDKRFQMMCVMFAAEFEGVKIEKGKVNDDVLQLLNGFITGLKLGA